MIILDLGLPDLDGIELLKKIRSANSSIPILILTARDSVEDRVAGLDSGADDYLVKPFAFAELLARIRVLLRRGDNLTSDMLSVADLSIDVKRRRVERCGKLLDLTLREFDLLLFLTIRAGETVSREILAREVLGIKVSGVAYDNIMDVHISNLRRKIDADFDVRLLHTLRGVGFILEAR